MKSTGKTGKSGVILPIVRSVVDFLRENRIPEDAAVLAAFSGGPDSTALLGVLNELVPECLGSVRCAYLDHGIRSESERERELAFISEFASRLGNELTVRRLEPGLIESEARSTGRSVEEIARGYRYGFLHETAEKTGSSYIALGHTADDNVETLIMRFFQGSGPGGLAGIPPRRGNLIRPLIGSGRRDVLEYLAARGYGYMTDSSNLKPEFLRNRVRLHLIPMLESIFPGYAVSLPDLARRMQDLNYLLNDESERLIPWAVEVKSYIVSREAFFSAPLPLRIHAVYRVFDRLLGIDGYRLPARFLNPIRKTGADAGDRILLRGHGFVLRTAGNSVLAERDIVIDSKTRYSVSIDIQENEIVRSIPEIMDLRVRTLRAASFRGDTPWVFRDIIEPPLVIRSRRSDDVLLTESGTKPVSKLLSEWKIPHSLRTLVPVLEDSNGLLGVFGSALGYKDRYAKRCFALRSPDRIIMTFSVQIYGV